MAATIVEGAAALLIALGAAEAFVIPNQAATKSRSASRLRLILSARQLRRLGWTLDNWLHRRNQYVSQLLSR